MSNTDQNNEISDATLASERFVNCDACKNVISSKTQLHTTCCEHNFHKSCLAKCIKIRPYCPVCNVRIVNDQPQVGVVVRSTRSQSKSTSHTHEQDNSFNTGASGSNKVEDTSQNNQPVTLESVQEMVRSLISSQQSQIISTLSNQISKLVETQVSDSLGRLNLGVSPSQIAQPNPNIQSTYTKRAPILPTSESRAFSEFLQPDPPVIPSTSGNISGSQQIESVPIAGLSPAHLSYSSDLNVRPDKVLQIISNWKIKFSGSVNSISVENFIYRIEALTVQTLLGNYDLLCKNASALFEGKASDWFWRFHRSVVNITWPILCRALRQQYRDSRTDVDIRELIRDRKQKLNETFDVFYESIVQLIDHLSEPLPDSTLVEILRRNLIPEIQHEILNMQIYSVQHLRDICRRREFFMQDIRRKHSLLPPKPLPLQKRISELGTEVEDEELEVVQDEISALGLVCWNCHQNGHRYHDCLSERTIFCYGCGCPDTYKPNCRKCSSKNLKTGAQKSAPRPAKSVETESQ